MPLQPKNAIAEIVRQHPHIPNDQLLEEAKRVFSQYKGQKVGATVTMEDVEDFRKTQVKVSGYTPEDASSTHPSIPCAEVYGEVCRLQVTKDVFMFVFYSFALLRFIYLGACKIGACKG
jgi:hypothetical protein